MANPFQRRSPLAVTGESSMKTELESFNDVWERESAKTIKLLESLPVDGYDFRPDPEGRSLGELAWHLAETEAFGSFGIDRGGFSREHRPPGIERPRKIQELSTGFERIHRDAAARVQKLQATDLYRSITSFNGQPIAIRDVLWISLRLHGLHHRGRVSCMRARTDG